MEKVLEKIQCYHCGETCESESFEIEEKHFCCFGCKTVYEILNENQLCQYYLMQDHPGKSQNKFVQKNKYTVLENRNVFEKFLTFEDAQQQHLHFFLPHIHCSSCIWLLENLSTLDEGILYSRVDFRRKEIFISINPQLISVKTCAEKLDQIGYEPYLSFQNLADVKKDNSNKSSIIKLGIAGFCFGNIMLFSFPEYLANGATIDTSLQRLFQYLSFLLSLPVVFYCALDFYTVSWKSLKNKFLHIDVPIALAIIFTFLRSMYAVFIDHQSGYFDSLSGIVFFMLIGRFFQNKSFKAISFERDYKSYFPLSVSKIENKIETQIALSELKNGDQIFIRNGELIPSDSIILKGNGNIDYSFVTGESDPVEKNIGEIIYAGGKQIGGGIHLKIIKDVSQSYLANLWNHEIFSKEVKQKNSFVHVISKYFSFIVLSLSLFAFIFWMFVDSSRAFDALISPLIVACPCALLLSATFTYGNALAKLGAHGMYVKSAASLEAASKINTIVFDKTGTMMQADEKTIAFEGNLISNNEKIVLYNLCKQSIHPVSKSIATFLGQFPEVEIKNFSEHIGNGIEGIHNGEIYKVGSAKFINAKSKLKGVFISIDNIYKGRFYFKHTFMDGVQMMLEKLKSKFPIYVLTGDNDLDKKILENYFDENKLIFNCSPSGKLEKIKELQQHDAFVMMVGDGLNDAGALKQSDFGIALSENTNQFAPASDMVLERKKIQLLVPFISFAKRSKKIIVGSFILSIVYNIFGLSVALQGNLSPIIAAILMPLSTITIVTFTTGMVSLTAHKLFPIK